MDRALELGINFFDTADVYGRGGEQGDTEEILGRWFAQGGGRRDAVVLATKVFNPVKRRANWLSPTPMVEVFRPTRFASTARVV